MNILCSKYVQWLLLSLCQIITFIVVYEAFWRLYIFLTPDFRRDISWGLNVRFAVIIFAVISLAGAIIGTLLFIRHQLLVQWFCVLSFACFFLGSWSYTPYRTSFLMACGVVGFLIPFYLLRRLCGNVPRVLGETGEVNP
jgi:hypothetical protein